MYACGPTVYRYAHVGNLRTFLLADLIRRVVLYHGIPVLAVQNITDVGHLRDERFDRGEDRMLVAAGLEHKTTAEIADAYEAAFHADAALLNLLPAHVFPRATEHIPEMIDLAERLVDAGHAYVSARGQRLLLGRLVPGLRRAVRQHPRRPPGRPSRRDRGRQARPRRLRALEGGRRGPDAEVADRRAGARASRAGISSARRWPSAISAPRFDVHTGGIDNVFPHHEDEIAQSAPIVGGPPARIWVHGEFLNVGGRKMAKSAGNIERIADVAGRGIDPLAFRYLCLTSRYRHKLEYTDASLAGAAAGLASLRAGLAALGPGAGRRPVGRAGAAPGRDGRRPADRDRPAAWPATATARRAR